jgi:acyl dehydratase
MEKLFYEDYAVGEKLRSPGRTITETDIVMFSAFTGDWHPLHTNVEFAKKTIFGERIAHGMLTLCVGSALMFRLGMYAALRHGFGALHRRHENRRYDPLRSGNRKHGGQGRRAGRHRGQEFHQESKGRRSGRLHDEDSLRQETEDMIGRQVLFHMHPPA